MTTLRRRPCLYRWRRRVACYGKGKHADLDAALNQLRQYALALKNPPLLIVSNMGRFRIRTNWTNSVSVTHEFTLDELADGSTRDKLKWAMSDPERLRPGETLQAVTERAVATVAGLSRDTRKPVDTCADYLLKYAWLGGNRSRRRRLPG